MTRAPRKQSYQAFGDYVRAQRELAQLSLRQAAALARISNPYLSQIEHGLALPSMPVIRALAESLQVSADTLLLLAAGLSHGGSADRVSTEEAIRHDARLDGTQKKALLAVLTSYLAFPPATLPEPPSVTPEGDAEASPVAGTARRRQPPKAPATKRKPQ